MSRADEAVGPDPVKAATRIRTRKATAALPVPPEEEGSSSSRSYSPVDADAETQVLCALMTTPQVFADVAERLVAEDFGVPAHEAVFAAILACDVSGRACDPVTVADELKRSGQLERVGGVAFLDRLVAMGAYTESVSAHVEIVVDRSLARRTLAAAREIAVTAVIPATTGVEAVATAERLVFELGRTRQASTLVPMVQAVAETMKSLSSARTSLLLGHSTGFTQLDAMTAGMQPGQLLILAARPGMGKTALALQIARNVAETSGLMVPVMSFEMSRSELTMRLLSNALGYDLGQLRQGIIPEGMERELALAAERMSQLPMLLDDNPPATITGMRSSMRRLARRGQIGAIVIDYIQLMEGDGKRRDDTRNQEVSDISRGLKRLATELEVPVLALSQLNRAVEQRPNKRPLLSDLRESGCLTRTSRISLADGSERELGDLFDSGDRNIRVLAENSDGQLVPATMTHAFSSGVKETFFVRLSSGRTIEATASHPFRTPGGYTPLGQLQVGAQVAVVRTLPAPAAAEPALSGAQVADLARRVGSSPWQNSPVAVSIPAEAEELLQLILRQSAARIATFLRHLWVPGGAALPGSFQIAGSPRLASAVQTMLARVGVGSTISTTVVGDQEPGYLQRGDVPPHLHHVVRPQSEEDHQQLLQVIGQPDSALELAHKEISPNASGALPADSPAVLPQLSRQGHVQWDVIAEIYSLGMHEVYDATVPEYANFVANGMLLHNSLEQDASAVMFLYRPVVYDPSADPKEAELILGKQRNGPTGSIPLDWNGPATRYENTTRTLTADGEGGGNGGGGGAGGGRGGANTGGGNGGGRPGAFSKNEFF